MDPTLSSKMVGFNRAKGEICSECSASSLLQVITPGIFECLDVSWVFPAETSGNRTTFRLLFLGKAFNDARYYIKIKSTHTINGD